MASLRFTEGDDCPPRIAGFHSQLLPNIVDGMAQTRPEAAYALIPKSFTSYEAGYRTVTYKQLANTVNGVAWFLSERVKGKNQTLAYIGPNDIGYISFILGAVKAGHAIMCLSPRNTKADFASLLRATECTTLLTLPPPYSPTTQTILESVEEPERLAVIHIPTIYELLEAKYAHFPYPKTFADARDETLAIVHTSGTTGTPKVVKYPHAFAASYNRWMQEPAPDGYERLISAFQSLRAFTTFPFFHGGGLMVALLEPIPNQTTIVTALAGVPLSAQGIIDALDCVEVDIVHMPAPFAEQIAKDDRMLGAMTSKARAITYGGGDISEFCAQAFLSRGVYVGGFNGSTESSPYPLIRPVTGWEPEKDLKYIKPHTIANAVFEATNLPDLFEMVIVRNPPHQHLQPVFTIFPQLTEWRTKDLFSPHPSKPGFWLYRSRADDMIVSANTDMCNPIALEQHVSRSPDVAAALMFGTGRYQKGLLVEPAAEKWLESAATREQFIEKIWPVVEAANQAYPQVSHVQRSHILLVTDFSHPLRRAGKGTVQRAPSIKDYQEQIDQLYSSMGDGIGDSVANPYWMDRMSMDKNA